MPVETIAYRDGAIVIVDQTRLPGATVRLELRTLDELCEAIESLRVRGAPALGVAAAYGLQLEAERFLTAGGGSVEALRSCLRAAAARLARTRPTARNLFWAVERLRRVVDAPAASAAALVAALARAAAAVHTQDRALCQAIATHGAALLPARARVLTHCNAGALATGGIGTALGVVYEAVRQGKQIEVFADETRPLLQGARLTAWELQRAGIPVTVLCDNAAASLLQSGRIDCVVVGADRIARNGDTANKIGTFGVALAAAHCGVPFYVAAPSTTFDLSLTDGGQIPIEARSDLEVTAGFGTPTAPAGVPAYNPAFDVTPAALIAAIVHEGGVVRPPFAETIPASLERLAAASPASGPLDGVGNPC